VRHRVAQAEPPAGALEYGIYDNVLLVPSRSRSVYRNIDGAVFDAALSPLPESLLTRTWRDGQIGVFPKLAGVDAATAPLVDETHIYGGYFFDHFGHFLLESLARSWAVEAVGPLPFVWAAGGPVNVWQAEILALLGMRMPQRFPDRPTRFRRLIIPSPGYRVQGEFHSGHARFLGQCRPRRSGSDHVGDQRVWLSRTGNRRLGRSAGEARLENELERRGWRVLHPQGLPVGEQLSVLTDAAVVAGLEGSAFHAAILLAQPASPFVILRRTANRNYKVIAAHNGNLTIDLFGAFCIDHREDLSLRRPTATAASVHRIADAIERRKRRPERLSVLKRRCERLLDLDSWLRRQKRRRIRHAVAWLRARLLKRIRRRLAR